MNDNSNTNAHVHDTRDLADRLAASQDPATVEALYAQALEERHAKRYAEAEKLLRRAWDLCAKVCAPDAILVEQIALDLGWACARQGNTTEAKDLYCHALGVNDARVQLGKDTNVSTALRALADLSNDSNAGIRISKAVLQKRVKALGATHPAVGKALQELAHHYMMADKNDAAARLYRRACDIMQAAYGLCHGDVADALQLLADLHDSNDDHAAVVPLYERVLAIWLKMLPDSDWGVHTCLGSLSSAYAALGRRDAAVQLYRKVLRQLEKKLGKTSPDLVKYFTGLASLLADGGEYATAERCLVRACSICKKEYGANAVETADVLDELAQLRANANQTAKAEATFREALTIYRRTQCPDKEREIQQKLEALTQTPTS